MLGTTKGLLALSQDLSDVIICVGPGLEWHLLGSSYALHQDGLRGTAVRLAVCQV
jgi:hypothetical protein